RALGRPAEAVAIARRATEGAKVSEEDQKTTLSLQELVAAEREAGEVEAALEHAIELNQYMSELHRAQTAQVVKEVWVRAATELERRRLEAQTAAAIRSAEEDALTRVGNRRLLERFLTGPATEHPRLALLMVDIDHFKKINDTFGHDVGDHVLRALGQLLATESRAGQVVVRYGGEEFVLALPDVELGTAQDFAERLRLKIKSHPWEMIESMLGVTVSIGVSSGSPSAWRSVLTEADRALYHAKQSGRDQVRTSSRARRSTAVMERTSGTFTSREEKVSVLPRPPDRG
ncbi:MAG TPA: GGDEF domain-containing protein, partial [Acidimicrobiales bacterium]|nr:GGDEF domain-containing protein [Acidimicrobiales bacterium]